ncbi:MAG TPA: TlpA disulfide reductase family protein [Chitinophagaceae bacterium]
MALAVNPQTFPIFSPITFIFATLAFILGEVAKKKNEKSKRPFVFYLILLGTISSFLFITFYYTPHLLFNRNREKISPSSSVYDKLNFSNLNDTPFDKNRLRNKILFIDNWFLSCYQCNLKLPSLQALYEKIQSDSTILILSVINGNIDSLNKVVEFVNKNKEFKFQILYDKENSLGKLIKVDGYPIELIIDKSGFMRERHDGFNKDERLIYVNETLKKIVSFK